MSAVLKQINPLANSLAVANRIAEQVPNALFCGFKTYTDAKGKVVKHPLSLEGDSVGKSTSPELLVSGSQLQSTVVPDATHWGVYMQSPTEHPDGILWVVDLDYKRATSPVDLRIKSMTKKAKDFGILREKSHSEKGAHLIVIAPDDVTLPAKIVLAEGQEIELFGHSGGTGKSVMLTGTGFDGEINSYPDMRQLLNDLGIDNKTINASTVVKPSKTATTPDYGNGGDIRTSSTSDRVADVLRHVRCYDDYDQWLKVGMAIKDELGDAGFNDWDRWSAQSEKYDASVMFDKWESFKGTGVGFGTVVMMAQANGYRVERVQADVGRFDVSDAQLLGDARPKVNQSRIVLPPLTPISADEMEHAKLSPREICPDLLYADVRMRFAAGGVGKTTVSLYEAITLALCCHLWDRLPSAPVKTVLITREDGRQLLTARMREIMNKMNLSAQERKDVLARVMIYDLSSSSVRLSRIASEVVEPDYDNLNALSDILAPIKPDWLIFDPLVSFGVGESRVNDAEQGLIESFRILRNRFDACVEAIHHTGKQNGRDKTDDQYSGRGGSALSDGARMIAVMNPMEPDEFKKATGLELEGDNSAIRMSLPKLSFRPKQEPIIIERDGYTFTQRRIVQEDKPNDADIADQVLRFIESEYQQERKYSATDLEQSCQKMGLNRQQVRSAKTELTVSGRIIAVGGQGKNGSHLQPSSFSAEVGRS